MYVRQADICNLYSKGLSEELLDRLSQDRDKRFFFRGDEMMIPMINIEQTGQNIMRLRREAGMSVRDIQDIMGFTNPQAIYKWQHGECLPAIDNLVILASIFGVTVDDILIIN